MAIIRKGDKAAEAALKKRAEEQGSSRPKRDSGKNPSRIKVSSDKKTGKSKAVTLDMSDNDVHPKKYTKPITGKSVAAERVVEKRVGNAMKDATTNLGSGVIKKGKLIKGGNSTLGDSLKEKKGK